jgi:hypothetical protein
MSKIIAFVALASFVSVALVFVRKAIKGRMHNEGEAWATLYAFGSISAEEYIQALNSIPLHMEPRRSTKRLALV